MGAFRFINDHKCTTLVWDIHNAGVYAYMGTREYGKSLNIPLNFAVNLKVL